MHRHDEFRANAAECQHMAETSRNEQERRLWQDMADSWLRMSDREHRAETLRAETPEGRSSTRRSSSALST